MTTQQMLKSISVFAGMSAVEVANLIADAEERVYLSGEVIFQEGAIGAEFFLVVSGKVDVIKEVIGSDGHKSATRLSGHKKGDVFGELALFEQQPRAAGAVACTKARLLVFNQARFDLLRQRHPQFLLHILSNRLRESLRERVQQMEAKNRELFDLIDRLKFLQQVSHQISQKKPLAQILNEVVVNSKKTLNADGCSLYLYDPADQKLHFHIIQAQGDNDAEMKGFAIDLGVGIAGWVGQQRQTLVVADCYQDARFNPELDRKLGYRTRSMICAPMLHENRLVGVLQVVNKNGALLFDQNDLLIFETLTEQCAIAIENARLVDMEVESKALERELETARKIQQRLLPASLPVYTNIEVAARLIPAKQVGGDYYNILKINDDTSLLVIADVSGKNISAAMLVSTLCAGLDTYRALNPNHIELIALITVMNQLLLATTAADKYVTAWFGLYDHRERVLTSVNAGHNPPYIFRPEQERPIELTKGGFFLGIIDLPYEQEITILQPRDVLAFFTDGVTEAWNEAQENYEERRLIRVVQQHLSASAEEILAAIEMDVKRHVGAAEQSDDFTCAVLKVLS